MKLLNFASILVFLFFFCFASNAQKVEETKIEVIEKTTDANGNVVTHKIVKTGDEAKEYIKQKKKELGVDVEMDGKTKTIRKEVSVEVNEEDSSNSKQIRVKIIDDEGNEQELEWDGDGQMPEKMKKYIEEDNVDIDVVETTDGNIRVEVISNEKPRLGVFPENHVDGVEIKEVIKDSAADKAGLQKGDIIFKINDKTIGSTLQLTDRLKNLSSEESSIIHYLRNGEIKSTSVNL
ncbi:PDZ domain-containing protein [Portibacter lacus]|uniref:PDZ domain-containing protein n=1 Tax=Portibacter lacus TaxID=1099794 RepID=A0AA37SQU3_9BACT|nr:PDZ domain-containing protein [Portibacter lacus]GLR18130.1 hypothetical protein GCM10007940_27450 [Portibacter lacus]